MKLIKNLTAFCLLAAPAYAQTNFTYSFNDAEENLDFGTWQQGTNAVGYTGPFTGYTSSTDGNAGSNGFQANEGIGDGNGTLFSTSGNNPNAGGGQLGTYTWVSDGVGGASPGISLDLDTVGSSVTFQFANFFLANNGEPAGGYSTDFSLFEFGLVNGNAPTIGTFNDTDSFYIEGNVLSVEQIAGGDVTGEFDLQATTNQGTQTSLLDSLDTLTIDSLGQNGGNSGATHGNGVGYQYDVTFTTAADGSFDIDYTILEFTADSSLAGSVATFTGTEFSDTTNAVHGLSDLTNLHLGFGFTANSGNVPISGTTFDSFTPVPEPSSSILVALSGLAMMARRRRN